MKNNTSPYPVPLYVQLGALLITPLIALFIINYPKVTRPSPPSITTSNALNPSPQVAIQEDDPYERLINKLQERQALSESDKQAKKSILSFLSEENHPGNIYNTQLYAVDYLQSADYFQVEILTANIKQAKVDASGWFASQGMSQQGICNLPIQFYLSTEVRNYLQRPSVDINPLPDGC